MLVNPFTIFVALLALAALCVAVAALSVANRAKAESARNSVNVAALFRRTGHHGTVLEAVAKELGVPADTRKTTNMVRPAALRTEQAAPIALAGAAPTAADEDPPSTRREGSGERALPTALESGDEDEGEEATRVATRPGLRTREAENS
jgi:hypothetical protein